MTVFHSPDLSFESQYNHYVCGIDEAGRGPLAGPVYAAAVRIDKRHIPEGINDSKKLNAKKREALARDIYSMCEVGLGVASVAEIDNINILNATMLAMQRAYHHLPSQPDVALIDGNKAPDIPCQTVKIVKGDSRSLSVAAASIIAKVERDNHMKMLHELHPQYGFAHNAGYGTKTHKDALLQYGATEHHRISFRPVREARALHHQDAA